MRFGRSTKELLTIFKTHDAKIYHMFQRLQGRAQTHTAWFKKMDSISYVYISSTIHGMWVICITFERGGPKFSNTTARALAYHTAVQQRQLRAKWLLCSTRYFAFVSSLKLSRRQLCSVRFVFVSTFNLQRGTAFVVGITNLSKAKFPTDHVYQRRTWDEFKRVLSVAHASQPVERAENLEYRNQLSGVCWGAVYCSSHIMFVTNSNYEI